VRPVIAWFATHPVAANLLLWGIVAGGLVGLPGIRQEAFPQPSFDLVAVTVEYPAAAPGDVEASVCIPIEEAIGGIEQIRRLRSTARRGFANVTAELADGADVREVLERIRTRVDAIDSLPDEAKRPIVEELVDDTVLLGVVVHGEADTRTLRRVGERVRDELMARPEIERAELGGIPGYEVSIEVSEAALRRHGLTFDEVANTVRASSLDLPAGSLKAPWAELTLRLDARATRGAEFERLPLAVEARGAEQRPGAPRGRSGAEGAEAPLALGDVARVVDGFRADDAEWARFDGSRAAVVRLLSGGMHDVVEASRVVDAYLREAPGWLPEGVELSVWNDESRTLASRRDLLLRNAAQGFALVLVVLALFLRPLLALWVTVGAFLSFLGGLAVMAALDVSINMMSLFGFIVALGLVVDDAIVVGENADRRLGAGAGPVEAAVRGAQEVWAPVTAAVLTTVLFMAPALELPTIIGKIARPLMVVAMACLLVSLLESLLVLPAHLAHARGRDAEPTSTASRALRRVRKRVQGALGWVVERAYLPLLAHALRQPGHALALALAPLLIAGSLVLGGWVRFTFLPAVEADVVSAELVLPEGTPAPVTRAVLDGIEAHALALRDRLDGEGLGRNGSVFEHVLTSVGAPPDEHDDFKLGGDGPHVGRVRIRLAPGEERGVTSQEVEVAWREAVGPVLSARSLRFIGSEIADEPALDLRLSGPDLESLRRAAAALKAELTELPGVREVEDSLQIGRPEVHLGLTREGRAAGLSLAELARQVRQGFLGEEAQRIQRGRFEVPVTVRYPAAERRSLADLEHIRIRTPAGAELPFASVATATLRRGYSTIERAERRRTVDVRADVDTRIATANEIMAELERQALPELRRRFPGVQHRLGGLQRDERELLASLLRGWALAMLAIYALLAIPLRSYLQPLAILAAVPFGLIGAVAGHLALGLHLSAFSLVGLVALSGVVVNDALVMIDGTNQRLRAGASLESALTQAARLRFRPILLTSLTTFLGLAPLLFERSAQADWLKPMAATLAFGLLIATGVILFVVPACTVALERARRRVLGPGAEDALGRGLA